MRSLPTASTIKDQAIRHVLEPIQDALSILGGNKGRIEDSAIIKQELIDIGLIRIENGKIIYNPDQPIVPPIQPAPVLSSPGSYSETLSISVSGSGATKAIDLTIDTIGRFVVHLWLTDTTDPSRPTVVPPTGGSKVDWMIVTESDGSYSEDVTNTTVNDWYVNGMIVGKIDTGTLLSFT